MYRHMLFDVDNTLIDFHACECEIFRALAHEFGFSLTTTGGTDLLCEYRRINRALWQRLERAEITPAAVRRRRFEMLAEHIHTTAAARPPDPACLDRAFMRRLRLCAIPVPGALALIRSIAPITIVTNGFAEVQHSRLAIAGISAYARHVFVSEEVGAGKPQREFFDHVLRVLGDPAPAECIIVGDSVSSDITGGKRAGMTTVLFDPGDDHSDGLADYRIRRLSELRAILGAEGLAQI